MNLPKHTTICRSLFAILVGFLMVVGSGSVAAGDLLNAPKNGLTRSGSGHGYADEILEGGTGKAFAGHGELRYGSGEFVVPNGTSITMPRRGHKILDITGQHMERGDLDGLLELAKTNPRVADDLIGMSTYLPGAKIPNLHLKAPNNLTIYSASRTVEDATEMFKLIKEDMADLVWALVLAGENDVST